MDILEAVNEKYETLSPAQKRIADYIFKYPDEVCFYSLKELSESQGVTEVTVLRFVKKIGLTSFVELKRLLKEHLQTRLSQGDPLDRISDRMGKRMEKEEGSEEQYRSFVENELRVLRDTYSRLQLPRVLEAVSIIRQAKHVYVIGSELTTALSSYLSRRLLTLGIMAVDLGCISRAIYNDYMIHIGPEDAVVLFSVPGYAKHVVNTTKFLEKNRVPQILITDKELSPAAASATITLTCDNRDLFFYNSVMGFMSLSNLLVYFCALQNPEETNRRRGRLSEAREAIGSIALMKERK